MKISVIGTGYVGLVSATCLAFLGHDLTCVDIDSNKVSDINNGIAPIHEDNLQDKLVSVVRSNKLVATTDLRQSVLNSDVSLIAVGTPFDGVEIDLSFVKKVSEDIGKILREKKSFHLVIIKSTVVPGTTDDVVASILEQTSGKCLGVDFGVAMNPEFLREGSAVEDFLNPDRIVLGSNDIKSKSLLDSIYNVFPEVTKMHVSCKTAEMIKYTSNSFFASLISFSNEIANLCSATSKINVDEVFKGLSLDRRISPILENKRQISPDMISYLKPGCGFGGSCFPKDVKALINFASKLGCSMPILSSVIDVNNAQPRELIGLMRRHFKDLDGIKVGILGFAFKPNTDDIRESPQFNYSNASQSEL